MVVYTDTLSDVAPLLKEGAVGVLRTDTLYGIVANAANEKAVERVYAVKGRTPTKPPIILISSVEQILTPQSEQVLSLLGTMWPGKNSVIVPAVNAPSWLVRSGVSLAYRIPDHAPLRAFLASTGPLIAPSANPEGAHPAMTIDEAKAYFGSSVDFYVDGGTVLDDNPSRLYRLNAQGLERLR
jgi:L-threonylcarbamoyladenylate synthase